MTEFFIDRPIFAWVLSIVIALIGGVAALVLPIDQYPPITPPTVTVMASYPGASARVVADTIGAPIEQQVNGVERMLYMSSQSTNDGNYVLTVTFEVGADLNLAQVLVQNRVALAMPQLPQQVQLQGVSTKKKSPNVLLVINLISPDGSHDDLYLSNYATIQVRDELLRIAGVGDLSFLGQRDYSMRIWLDPEKLASRSLTAVDVVNAIRNQNVQVAAGQVGQQPVPKGQELQLPMSTLGRLDSVEQFGDIILRIGAPSSEDVASQVVRVRDVARIELGAQSYDQICRLDSKPSVGVAVFQLPGSNALAVAEAVQKKMKELKRSFPPGIDYRIVYDTTPFIRQSVDEVFNALIDAVLLVAIVVLFFLQDWRAMILPMIDVPVALIGTFAVMALLGFSLNNLTLFGLVLVIGIVVDDAIVVLENIERLIATGLDARSATIKAMREVTGPIIAITLVLSAVFLPSAFIPGIVGQFYRQFALTIAASMIISALNAMTLTPSRAAAIFKTQVAQPEQGQGEGAAAHLHQREALPWWIFIAIGAWLSLRLSHTFLDPLFGVPAAPGEGAEAIPAWQSWGLTAAYLLPGAVVGGIFGWFSVAPINRFLSVVFRGFNRFFDRVTAAYGTAISHMLRLALVVVVVYGGLVAMTVFSVARAPIGFLPLQDQGYLLVNVQLPDSASVQRTQDAMMRIEKIAHSIPGVRSTTSVAGMSMLLGVNGSNLGTMFVILEGFDKRGTHEKYDAVIAERIQKKCFREIEEAVVGVFRAPPIRGLASAGGFRLQTEQRGYVDLDDLQAATDAVVVQANKDPRFAGAFTLFRASTPQLYLDIDRTKCEALLVPMNDVFTTLQVFMGGMYVNNFNQFGRTWQVQIQADEQFRQNTEPLKQFQVRNKEGDMVPLGTLTQVKDTAGPVMVMRYNMYVSAPVNVNPAPAVSSGQAIAAMEEIAGQVGVSFEWTEIAFLQIQAGNLAPLIFGLGTILVYLILAAKYESWGLPLSVILVVPLCVLGALAGMFIAQMPVDIFVQIGFLVLIGLASKNAILIVEFAKQKHDEGMDVGQAILESSRLRFRPIVMTSFAFIFGVLPLVLAHGAGAEMRISLGTAVFAGMIGVTFFGVMLTPVFYYVVMKLTAPRPHPAGAPSSVQPAAARPDGEPASKPEERIKKL